MSLKTPKTLENVKKNLQPQNASAAILSKRWFFPELFESMVIRNGPVIALFFGATFAAFSATSEVF